MTVPPADETTAGWWEATREHRLVLERCRACGRFQHYPRGLCTSCGAGAGGVELVDASGGGRLHSFTVVQRSPAEGVEVPYVIALVDLDEGPRLLTRVVAPDHGELACDRRVVVAWDPLPDGRALPVFRPS